MQNGKLIPQMRCMFKMLHVVHLVSSLFVHLGSPIEELLCISDFTFL